MPKILITLLALVVNDFVNSMLAHIIDCYRFGCGRVKPLYDWLSCSSGYNDAYFKGIRGFDVEKAYHAMKTSAMQTILGKRAGMGIYRTISIISRYRRH